MKWRDWIQENFIKNIREDAMIQALHPGVKKKSESLTGWHLKLLASLRFFACKAKPKDFLILAANLKLNSK